MDDFFDDFDDECSDGIGWEEIALLGAMAEQIAEEKKEQERIEREMFEDDDLDPEDLP